MNDKEIGGLGGFEIDKKIIIFSIKNFKNKFKIYSHKIITWYTYKINLEILIKLRVDLY